MAGRGRRVVLGGRKWLGWTAAAAGAGVVVGGPKLSSRCLEVASWVALAAIAGTAAAAGPTHSSHRPAAAGPKPPLAAAGPNPRSHQPAAAGSPPAAAGPSHSPRDAAAAASLLPQLLPAAANLPALPAPPAAAAAVAKATAPLPAVEPPLVAAAAANRSRWLLAAEGVDREQAQGLLLPLGLLAALAPPKKASPPLAAAAAAAVQLAQGLLAQ